MREITKHQLDRARVAQVRVEHDRGDRRGSGYRVSDVVVLTAAHVVEGASTVQVVFNADLSNEWSTTANVALCESAGDVALLELDWSGGPEPVPPARFGRLDRHGAHVFDCRTVGFPVFDPRPWARVGPRRTTPGPYRGWRQADGTIAPRSQRSEGTVEFTVTQLASDTSRHTFPWDGMAGAAIWCADKIVGVVSNHQHTDGRNRVAAADVTSWYAGLATDRLAELTEMLELPGSLDEVEPMHSARAGTLTTAEYCRAFPRRRHRILDVEREHAIADSFVQPPGWDDASRVLDESQILLLRAEPGSGGRTAAIHLLRDFGRPSEPIHELAPQRDLGPELLDPREIVADERLLLDLSAVGSEQVRAIMAELPLLDEGALHPDAVLVVVLPTGDEHLLEPELRPWTASVGRPDGRAVFRAQLAAQGVSGDYPSSPPQQLDAVLAHGTMAEIAGLARTVRAAQDRAEALSLADLIGEALAARAERNDEVAALVAQHADGGFRSLLLASAMLEGRTAEDVLEAQRSLLRMLDVATDTDHEFERAGLASRFHEVEAEIDSESVVRFPKLKCAEAIRRHLWTNYPAVGDGLRQWVVECGARMAWPSAAGDEFARRLVDACLSAQKPSDVLIAVSSWAFGGTTQVALAASALAYGLEDPRTGWWFRRHCYQWASTRTLQPQIAELVIPACVEIIAPNHPGHAVVLLHHFSRNRDSRVAGAARSALASLTDDRRVVRRLLARLTTSPHGRLDCVDRVLFLAAARPTTLTSGGDDAETLMADPDVRRELRIGWGAILSYCREAEYEKYVHRWLDAHVVDQTYGFLDVLVAACGDGFLPAATVRTIARHWYDGTPGSDDREDRWRTVQELDDRLYTFRRQR